jgi:secondary thiamine-phosphate synthase enzyme
MKLERATLEQSTTSGTDILDLTDEVEAFVAGSGVLDGWVLVFVPGATGAVTTIEFESGAVSDFKEAIERIAPQDLEYRHDLRWDDGNGYSHVRAALLGPSLTLPVEQGRVMHGTWQRIVLCDFDNRPRRRRILVQVLGS